MLAYLTGLHGDWVIKVERPQRTNPQNRWLWGIIYPMIQVGLVAVGWPVTNTEEVHAMCGEMFRGKDIVNEFTGEVVHIPQSSRDMDIPTMTAYCETLRDFAREYLNIEIPDPIKIY